MKMESVLNLTEKLQFAAEDFDEKGNIKASSLMYAFQEVASDHAERLGLGFDDLMAQNYIWVLTKLRFSIKEQMKPMVEYRLETYPRPKKGVTFYRDYYIYDGEGELMAVGTSYWCIINFVTRKVERLRMDFDGVFIGNQPFENGIEKFKIDQENLVRIGTHKVTEDDLDNNEHVNNCRYADMVKDVLKGHEDYSIHFSKEALLGDEIILYKGEEGEYTMVEGKLADDTIIFQVKTK